MAFSTPNFRHLAFSKLVLLQKFECCIDELFGLVLPFFYYNEMLCLLHTYCRGSLGGGR